VSMEMTTAAPEESSGDQRLAILLAMAMFVLVVDTSLMNVSISAVVHDLDTTASGVQSAIALEALVSAAFILIGSKIGDLIGRKRAYVLGLLGYAAGALSMTLTQSRGRSSSSGRSSAASRASLLLPSMQSLIHGKTPTSGSCSPGSRRTSRPRSSTSTPRRSARAPSRCDGGILIALGGFALS
jgi:hypothetical protein